MLLIRTRATTACGLQGKARLALRKTPAWALALYGTSLPIGYSVSVQHWILTADSGSAIKECLAKVSRLFLFQEAFDNLSPVNRNRACVHCKAFLVVTQGESWFYSQDPFSCQVPVLVMGERMLCSTTSRCVDRLLKWYVYVVEFVMGPETPTRCLTESQVSGSWVLSLGGTCKDELLDTSSAESANMWASWCWESDCVPMPS